MIRVLTSDDASDLRRMILSRDGHQLFKVDGFSAKLADRTVARLPCANVCIFGMFDNGELVAFIDTNVWQDDPASATLSTSFRAPSRRQERARDSTWPAVIIELVNHAVAFHEARGVTSLWLNRPDDPAWVPYTSAPDCTLNGYEAEMIRYVPAGEDLRGTRWEQVFPRLPTNQKIMRLRKKP